MERKLSQRRQRLELRRALINEIHFTYANLAKLMRAIVPREEKGRLGKLLKEQLTHDQQAQQDIVEVGLELGMPPGPCVCADSEALLEAVHHADRVERSVPTRDLGILDALRETRVFIIRRWGALLDGVEQEQGAGTMFERILRAQGLEADQHRELVRVASDLDDQEHAQRWKRSA